MWTCGSHPMRTGIWLCGHHLDSLDPFWRWSYIQCVQSYMRAWQSIYIWHKQPIHLLLTSVKFRINLSKSAAAAKKRTGTQNMSCKLCRNVCRSCSSNYGACMLIPSGYCLWGLFSLLCWKQWILHKINRRNMNSHMREVPLSGMYFKVDYINHSYSVPYSTVYLK